MHAQVRKIIWKLFELMPTPEAGMHADEEAVKELIQPLGLAPKRAPMLIRFCRDYVEKQVRICCLLTLSDFLCICDQIPLCALHAAAA